jgi:uncharacterized UBP type Zn finger protein
MSELQILSVIENGYNTCYIDALLVALFYKHNDSINMILESEPKRPDGFYLQELIKLKFVEPIKRNYSINSSIINEIRNYSIICGWSDNEDIDGQKDCSEFYSFLSELFNIKPIEFEILEIKNNTISENIKKIRLPFISLNLTQDDNIKNILSNWIDTQININNSKIFHCYKLSNIPQFIILYINRFNNDGTRNNYKLDIMKRIKFFGINDTTQNYLKWKIHSIICHTGKSIKSGHYYSVIYTYQRKWLLFDDNMIPSFEQIDMEDDDIKEKIMLESVMLIYTLE